jgi:MFS family permease
MPLVGIMLNGTSSVLYATVAEIISPARRSRGYGLCYAITQSSGALSPMIYGFITDSLSISFTVMCIALMALVTIPLSKFLSKNKGA